MRGAAAQNKLGGTHLSQKKLALAEKEFQLREQLYARHLAEVDKQQSEIQQFVYSMKGAPSGH